MAIEIKSATIFFQPGTKRPRKYRKITNYTNFAEFALKSGAWYINWYDHKTGKFDRRTWLISDFKKNQYL